MLYCVSQHEPKLVEKYCVENSSRNDTPTPNEFVTFLTKHFNKEPCHNIQVFGKSEVADVLDIEYQHLTHHRSVKNSLKKYLI